MTVLAADRWPSNAELIADVAELYLDLNFLTLDPTYGNGTWWKKWCPTTLVTHDIKIDGVDFRHLPEDDATFDAVAFDPPYVCVGGRNTTGLPELHERYGLTDAPKTPADLQRLMDEGLSEMVRVLKRKGILLMKCQDYISSGKLWCGTHRVLDHAFYSHDLELVDRLEHVGNPRPQPARSRQVHARRNLSTLFVFRKH